MRRELRLHFHCQRLDTVSSRGTASARTFASSGRASSDYVLLSPGPGAGDDAHQVVAALKRHAKTVTISTLDPTRLTSADYLTIKSTQDDYWLYVYTHHFSETVRFRLPRSERARQDRAHAGGFLYYHHAARAPPLAGELRFRVTPSCDPTSFPSGIDLVTDRGVPWSVPLPVIAKFKKYEPLRHLLTSVDETVAQQVIDLAQALDGHRQLSSGNLLGCRYIHSFGQSFDFALDGRKHAFVFIGKDRTAHITLDLTAFFSSGRPSVHHAPFSGRAICCFEPSPAPGERLVLMRILQSVEWDPMRPNPSYTGPEYPPELYPREGQLLMNLRRRKLQPWVGDVDGKLRKGKDKTAWPFGILFDNAVEYGSPYAQ
ncbi:hypothetical protein OH76DRAFT_1488084 [Lentinus brumalis]|uniref:Uncharacterized protein n=1 Tax=Lentinus brumalis TaxID=2498619 RepID=A0A371CSC7_9APHY|nr:hypothetical protein OH76DRAFT_1488084 [Polyporus brumalis]